MYYYNEFILKKIEYFLNDPENIRLVISSKKSGQSIYLYYLIRWSVQFCGDDNEDIYSNARLWSGKIFSSPNARVILDEYVNGNVNLKELRLLVHLEHNPPVKVIFNKFRENLINNCFSNHTTSHQIRCFFVCNLYQLIAIDKVEKGILDNCKGKYVKISNKILQLYLNKKIFASYYMFTLASQREKEWYIKDQNAIVKGVYYKDKGDAITRLSALGLDNCFEDLRSPR